jgi:hypothetical protein
MGHTMKQTPLLAIGLTVAAGFAWLLACGPFPTDLEPVVSRHPADPRAYASGDLGVVRQDFSIADLLQAYRTIAPPSPDPQTVAPADAPSSVDADSPDPARKWAVVSSALLGTPGADREPPAIDQSRQVPGSPYQTFDNCPDDAFATALRTLDARRSHFGDGSAPLREWVGAQAAVFENCHQGPLVLPPAPAAAADDLSRADRAYQTAAAYFYATEYEQAAVRFRAIAADRTSPWRPVGRYLAARANIRYATVPKEDIDNDRLALAEIDLRAALADPAAARIHRSARGLLAFVAARIHQVDRLHELSARLIAPAAIDGQDLYDYRFILNHPRDPRLTGGARYQSMGDDDLTDWLLTMSSASEAATTRAIERWRASKAPQWLVAALWHVRDAHAEANGLLAATQRLDPRSPAAPTVAFLRVRLLTSLGRPRDARAVLASLPVRSESGFSAETVNLFNAERLLLAENLDQFLAAAPRAVAMPWGSLVPRIPNGRLATGPRSHDEPIFDEDAATMLAEHFPLTRLVDAALSSRLPPRLRLRVAMAAFTRALMLRRDEAGVRLLPVLRDLAPALRPDLDRYARADAGDDRYRAGVVFLLNTPGATVDVRGAEDDQWFDVIEPARDFDHVFRRNWWCDRNGFFHFPTSTNPSQVVELLYPGGIGPPAFISRTERAAAERERRAILADGPPRVVLARAAIRLANEHRDDPAAPDSLARVVDGWRWTCGEEDHATPPLPQQAFTTLHRLFPTSAAAQRTRVWYKE